MSIRTIIEINHDYGHEIERDPEGFLRHLRTVLAGNDERSWEQLRLNYGFRKIVDRHHSTPCQVQVEYGLGNTRAISLG